MVTRTPRNANLIRADVYTPSLANRLRPADPLQLSPLDLRTAITTREAAAAWMMLTKELTNPAIELDSEEFALVWSLFNRARAAGAKFCPAFVALMNILARQMRDADADSDGSDWCVDDGFERDDADEDHPLRTGPLFTEDMFDDPHAGMFEQDDDRATFDGRDGD